jgi:hypothetical protein
MLRASIASQRERRALRERLSGMLTGRLFALLGPLDRIDDQLPCLGGIAIVGQGMRYKAIIVGIAHRRVKKPVNHERSRRSIHFLFDWLAPRSAPR